MDRLRLANPGPRILLWAVAIAIGAALPSGVARAEVASLYWSAVLNGATSVIQRANPDGSNIETVVTGAGTFTSPDIDVVQGKIYWCQFGQTPLGDRTGKLQRADLDGSNVEDVVPGLFSPFGLALDAAQGKIYWVDGQANKLQRANLDGSSVQDLVVGLVDPVALTLDRGEGKVYWTDFGDQTVSRANLDGTQREVLLTQQPGLGAVTIAGSGAAKKLYLADFTGGQVRRANPDGSAVEVLVSGVPSPTGIAVDTEGNRIFVSSLYAQRVQRAALDGSGLQTIATLATQPGGIALRPVTCGSATLEAGEACDDGNRADGDCCSSSCQYEAATVTCRAAAGDCDLPETCPGTSAICPADLKRVAPCRAAAGACDVSETCDGSSDLCPVDAMVPSGVECRPAAGVCDVAEACPGNSPSCPADAKRATPCRASAGVCDVAESCDGLADDCPADAFLPAGATCRAAAGVCDAVETCSGSAATCPPDLRRTAICRAGAGPCDIADHCDGVQVDCPGDARSPDDAECSDGAFCNGVERCHAGACEAGTRPCTLLCNEDGHTCETGCLPAPLSCRSAGKAFIALGDRADDDGDRLTWKWGNGASTSQAEFGDPTSTADYALCLYAGDGGALIGQAVVAASASAWSPLGATGYKYRDPAAAGGIATVILKGSDRNRSKVLVKGRGAGLPDPMLPIDTPLTVQLVNGDNGRCWGADFDAAAVHTNQAGHFQGRTP